MVNLGSRPHGGERAAEVVDVPLPDRADARCEPLVLLALAVVLPALGGRRRSAQLAPGADVGGAAGGLPVMAGVTPATMPLMMSWLGSVAGSRRRARR